MSDPWASVARWDPAELAGTLLETHHALQLVAAAGQAYAAPEEDDSHRAATWDSGRRSFVGQGFAAGYPFRVAVRPEDLTAQLLDRTGSALGSLPLGGRTLHDAYEWLRSGLSGYMGALQALVTTPDFSIPPHPVSRGGIFATGRRRRRGALADLYDSAARLLSARRPAGVAVDPVRIWPHHFDVGTVYRPEDGAADADGRGTQAVPTPGGTVGVGLSPGRGDAHGWYWYVNVHPAPKDSQLPDVGPLEWHTGEWTGFVLEGRDIVAAADGAEAMVHRFLDDAVPAALGVVTGPVTPS